MRFIRFIFITLAAIVAPVCIVGQVALTTGAAEEEAINTDAAYTTPMPLKMQADSLMRCYEAAKQSATAGKPYIYNLLNECFERNTEYLQSADITPTDYVAVKDRLRQLHPQLQFAGVFFAQQGDNATAVDILEKYINMPQTEAFKNEIELGLDVGIRNGMSAAEMSRDLRDWLRYPDMLFRRVRDEHGDLRLSQRASMFHPGKAFTAAAT